MNILGINTSIDCTAVVMRNGKVLAAIAEERLSRKKLHTGFPRQATVACLRQAGIAGDKIDVVALGFEEYLTAAPLVTELLFHPRGCQFEPENNIPFMTLLAEGVRILFTNPGAFLAMVNPKKWQRWNLERYAKELSLLGISRAKIIGVDHHRAHAASAYYCCGFDDVLVVTADGSGDGLSAGMFLGKNGKLVKIKSVPKSQSAGLMYAAVTKFLGFKPHRHEGKITGLAAFGRPRKTMAVLNNLLRLSVNKKNFTGSLGQNWKQRLAEYLRWGLTGSFLRQSEVNEIMGVMRRRLSGLPREDIAAGVQKWLEETISGWVKKAIANTGRKNIALAGGIFANVRLNQKIAELPGVKEIYVQPNMGDGGTALGAALVVWERYLWEQGKIMKPMTLQNVYLGPEFSRQEIKSAIKSRGLKAVIVKDIEKRAAEAVAADKIVGWFQGRMEFGPRALGNRSLLASATDRNINDDLNARLKRTEFMPFAPSVLDSDISRYMRYSDHSRQPSRFMTITFDCTKAAKKRVPAVVHVDGTARPQIVDRDTNPRYWRVLEEYKKITGLGIFVNTSFNIHEEPIVCSPQDAIRSFEKNSCDVLVMGDWWITK